MAKSLIYFAVGALALTACTSQEEINDVLTSKSNVIKFENVVNKPSRADITSSTLEHFYVFGFYTMPGDATVAHQVFYNTPVNKNGTQWDYSSDYGERYWIPGANYYFYAYSCNNTEIKQEVVTDIKYELDMEAGKDASKRLLVIDNYVCNNKHQHDLIFAHNTGATEDDAFKGILGLETGNNVVALQFKHILSKVKAKFTTKFPKEYQIVISDVSIQSIKDQGDYDIKNGWHNYAQTVDDQALAMLDGTTLMIENAMVGEGENQKQKSVETAQYYALPYNGTVDETTYALKFTIDVYVGDDRVNKVMSKTLTGKFTPTWEEGYQYVYNVDINGTTTQMQVISFTTSVDPFNSSEQSNDITEFEVKDNGAENN